MSDQLFSIQTAKTALTSACRNAGLPRFTHHHLRHFFCSNAIEAGIDFKTIAGWLGHKDGGLLVAKTYGHLRDEPQRGDGKANVVLHLVL
jgi:site-specific recombinase XerD